jgi:hypothetical protein
MIKGWDRSLPENRAVPCQPLPIALPQTEAVADVVRYELILKWFKGAVPKSAAPFLIHRLNSGRCVAPVWRRLCHEGNCGKVPLCRTAISTPQRLKCASRSVEHGPAKGRTDAAARPGLLGTPGLVMIHRLSLVWPLAAGLVT